MKILIDTGIKIEEGTEIEDLLMINNIFRGDDKPEIRTLDNQELINFISGEFDVLISINFSLQEINSLRRSQLIIIIIKDFSELKERKLTKNHLEYLLKNEIKKCKMGGIYFWSIKQTSKLWRMEDKLKK